MQKRKKKKQKEGRKCSKSSYTTKGHQELSKYSGLATHRSILVSSILIAPQRFIGYAPGVSGVRVKTSEDISSCHVSSCKAANHHHPTLQARKHKQRTTLDLTLFRSSASPVEHWVWRPRRQPDGLVVVRQCLFNATLPRAAVAPVTVCTTNLHKIQLCRVISMWESSSAW